MWLYVRSEIIDPNGEMITSVPTCVGWLHQRWSSQYHGVVKKNQEYKIHVMYVGIVSRANDKVIHRSAQSTRVLCTSIV